MEIVALQVLNSLFYAAVLFLILLLGAIAVALIGLVIEPTLIRPFYRRPEEYQLLVTFGLLLVLEDVIRFMWGGTPLTASELVDSLGLVRVGGLPYPVYNLLMIGVGAVAALALWAFV